MELIKISKADLKVKLELHLKWLKGEEGGKRANLQEADLRWADLQGANLREADLQGANLDFSCWPLWCGSQHVKVDFKLVIQLAAHLSVLDCEDKQYQKIKKFLLPYAKQFNHAQELGLTVDAQSVLVQAKSPSQ